MAKPLIDADALIEMFETASAKQGQQLRQAVSQATLQALQARELTLKNIRSTLEGVTKAANTGLAKNLGADVDATALLDKAVAGMDDALLRAVEANRTALSTLVAQGADLRDKHLKKAVDEIEKLEDTLMSVVKKAAESAAKQMEGAAGGLGKGSLDSMPGMAALASAWAPVLEKMNAGGTLSGAGATNAVEQLVAQMHSGMRSTRQASLRAAQALAESYAALASGVLIGMSEAMQQAAAPKAAPKPAAAPAPAAKRRPRKA